MYRCIYTPLYYRGNPAGNDQHITKGNIIMKVIFSGESAFMDSLSGALKVFKPAAAVIKERLRLAVQIAPR